MDAEAENPTHSVDPTDMAVLEYLRKKGMTSAALELDERLKEEQKAAGIVTEPTPDAEGDNVDLTKFKRQLEQDDAVYRSQRSVLSKVTGGGFGYDRDAAVPIIQWGVPDVNPKTSVLGEDGKQVPLGKKIGVEEARSYIESFTSLQLWVLSLPDDGSGNDVACGMQFQSSNPIKKAHAMMRENSKVSLSSLVSSMIDSNTQGNNADDERDRRPQSATNRPGSGSYSNLPPSAKPELLLVTFALLVHTYCELLEVGMESTAHVLRDAFHPIYAPLYEKEMRDLYHCKTAEDIMRLNMHNAQHMDALNSLKSKLVQVASLELKREELVQNSNSNQKIRLKIQEYDQTILLLKQKYNEVSQRASASFDRMHDVPFLRRVRAVRWQLTMSTMTYSMLSSFLNNGIGVSSGNSSMLAMSALLQSKCELHVERRDPLPFTPACVLDDSFGIGTDTDKKDDQKKNSMFINWAAPVPRLNTDDFDEILPFPKYSLEKEYEDEATAEADKRTVEFNRAVLINGFRRLEALERKREYQVMSSLATEDGVLSYVPNVVADPLKPSILLSTLCSNNVTAAPRSKASKGSSASATRPLGESAAMWEESGVGLCCAKACPPDGRRVAVGCDDSAIRVWNLLDMPNDGSMREPEQVLLGHKNGFPVFGVSWNRDGRSLLSAGGDGSVRLWDTLVQGPFGQLATPKTSSGKRTTSSSGDASVSIAAAKEGLEKATAALARAKSGAELPVPGLRPESVPYKSGGALAVYRGHAPNTPVWSVSFAPCGYYFASAGGDATARLWATDRTVPIRLFSGHTANSVNCVTFHPNCNYVLTGCDDRTARLWDIQTGCCVRLLDGCAEGLNVAEVSSCGKYAAGGDYSGAIHLWDLGTGKKVTEFRSRNIENNPHNMNMLHALSFSSCGTALAAGGDDCCVRVWDVRANATEPTIVDTPAKSFPTRRTMIMDLQFTKRNLLLSVGKYITPIPVTIPSD